jgi:hypothetical protein
MVPRLEQDKVGPTQDWENANEIPFSEVFVASDSNSATEINAAIAQGFHVVF